MQSYAVEAKKGNRMMPRHRRRLLTARWLITRLLTARFGLALPALLSLARCADTPAGPQRLAAAPPAAAAPSRPAPTAIPVATLDPDGKPILFNDPPAPANSPLCGRQAEEANAVAAAIQGPRLAASGICASFTCYDALTATYLGADGYRHVCR